MKSWVASLYQDAAAGRLGPSGHPLFRRALDTLHVMVVLVREVARDRLHVRAAMLAYWTAVAIVPILMLGFALTGPLGLKVSTRDAVRRLLYDTILASSVEDVGIALDQLLEAASLGTLGVIGVVGIMLIGSQLFFNAERAYNDIFRTRVDRSKILRFVLFYAGITLGPIAIAAGFVLTARFGAAAQVPAGSRLLPIALSAAVFVGALRLLPTIDVRWRAAVLGGLVSALLFELAKLGFGLYLDVFGTRSNLALVYGSVAFLPVSLLWTYVVWLVVLFGVEVAFVVHHGPTLLDAQRRLAADPHALTRQPDGLFAYGLVTTLGQAWGSGEGPLHPRVLAERCGAELHHVQTALLVMADSGIVVRDAQGRYLPARSLESLDAQAVVGAWRALAAPTVRGEVSQTIATTVARLGCVLPDEVEGASSGSGASAASDRSSCC